MRTDHREDRRLRYPARSLAGDYARAAAGLLLTLGPLLLVPVASAVGIVLAAAAALFALFALRTVQRHLTVVTADADGLAASGPFGARIAWDDIAAVRLTYYSTRRDRANGWMQLRVRGRKRGDGTVRLESTLDGFDAVAERVAEAARRNGVALSDTTAGNFQALGIETEAPEPVPGTSPDGPGRAGTWTEPARP